MKQLFFVVLFLGFIVPIIGQSYNQDRVVLKNYLTRMYMNQPFEGVRIVQDYDHDYLLSAVFVVPSSSELVTNRIAQVKCSRQISQFLDALVVVSSETIIKTTQSTKDNLTINEITDIIKENSVGYAKSMEILTILDLESGVKCYLFIRDINEMRNEP